MERIAYDDRALENRYVQQLQKLTSCIQQQQNQLNILTDSIKEIAELAGAENIYTFGKDSESIIKLYETAGYVSKAYYENDKEIKRAVDFILNPAVVKLGNKTRLERLYNELLNKDWFMTLIDFNAYVEAKEQILADYEDQDSWNEKVVHNIAKAGFFSSDRTIAQYNADIWHCEG